MTCKEIEQAFASGDFIDVAEHIPSIYVDLRYATPNNFTGRILYTEARCMLRRGVGNALAEVQTLLQKNKLGLKIWDAYRPFSIQRAMWAAKPHPQYVEEPVASEGRLLKGSTHNRGAAVDLTLVDAQGSELTMPSPFDDFSVQAHRNYQGGSSQSLENRKTLESYMIQFGFTPYSGEWWHFDGPDWEQYQLSDIPFAPS